MTVQTVKTHPCPRCASRRTHAVVVEGRAVWRLCNACGWEWDRDSSVGDKDDLLTLMERIRLIETGSLADEDEPEAP